MTELDYWKLKARMGQLRIEETEYQNALTKISNDRIKLMNEVGLDINKKYQFNDEKHEIEECK